MSASYWMPTLTFTESEWAEYERRRAGRTMYYVDDKGWPIEEGKETQMGIINEDRMTARINKWSGGSVLLAVAVALGVGVFVGAFLF